MLRQQDLAALLVHSGRRALSILCGSASRPSEPTTGFAVLRWWDNGVHDLFGFAALPRRAQQVLDRDKRFWRRDPAGPTGWAVIPVAAVEVSGHDRLGCRNAGCPGADRIAEALSASG